MPPIEVGRFNPYFKAGRFTRAIKLFTLWTKLSIPGQSLENLNRLISFCPSSNIKVAVLVDREISMLAIGELGV